MSTIPTRRSASWRWLAAVESWSGRSRRMSPRNGSSSFPSSALSRHVRLSIGTPSHVRNSSPPSPHTHAVGFDVVGRRTPTCAISSPDTALNSEDFPDPVEPANATTVRSSPRSKRASVFFSSSSASVIVCVSIRPDSSSSARLIPSRSRLISSAAFTAFLSVAR